MTAPLNVNQRLCVSISVELCTAQWNYQSCETPSICFDLCVKWIWLLVNFFPLCFPCCLIVLSSVCTVLCLIAILDVQANQRARCDIGCHWKSGIFSLPTSQQHSVCTPGKPSSSFPGAVKNHSDASPASLSYQKIWLSNPQGFGIKQWELPELQPLFSQSENSTVHTSQGRGIWGLVKSSPSPPFPAQNTGSDTRGWKESPPPRPSCLQPTRAAQLMESPKQQCLTP